MEWEDVERERGPVEERDRWRRVGAAGMHT